MTLQPWEWTLLGIVGVLVYVLAGGFAWALTSENFSKDERAAAAMFWPVSFVAYIVYRVGAIGPRAVARWRERKKIPRAEIRQ